MLDAPKHPVLCLVARQTTVPCVAHTCIMNACMHVSFFEHGHPQGKGDARFRVALCLCVLNTDVMQHAALADLKHFVVSVQILPVIGECDRLRCVCWIPFNIKC